MSDLPKFTYHRNLVAAESIVPSDETCECCSKARGYLYCTTPYRERRVLVVYTDLIRTETFGPLWICSDSFTEQRGVARGRRS